MPAQLLLPLEKNHLLDFKCFYPSTNPMAVETLKDWPKTVQMIYLQGAAGAGKTHLAEALTQQLLSTNQRVLFVSGKSLPAPHFFYELPPLDLFILDDLDMLLNFSPQYEEAIFALYNYIFDHPSTKLLLTTTLPIEKLPLKLKDLQSRLQSMLLLKLHTPSAQDLDTILAMHAKRLQITLTPDMQAMLIQQRRGHPVQVMTDFVHQSAKDKKKPSITYLKNFLMIQ